MEQAPVRSFEVSASPETLERNLERALEVRGRLREIEEQGVVIGSVALQEADALAQEYTELLTALPRTVRRANGLPDPYEGEGLQFAKLDLASI